MQLLYTTSIFKIYSLDDYQIAIYTNDDTLFFQFTYTSDLTDVMKANLLQASNVILGPKVNTHPVLSKILNVLKNKTKFHPIYNHDWIKNDVHFKFRTVFAPYLENEPLTKQKDFKNNTSVDFYFLIAYLQLIYLYYNKYMPSMKISKTSVTVPFSLTNINLLLYKGLNTINQNTNYQLVDIKAEQGEFYYGDKTKWVPWNDYLIQNKNISSINTDRSLQAASFLFSLQNQYVLKWELSPTMPIIFYENKEMCISDEEMLTNHIDNFGFTYENSQDIDDVLNDDDFIMMSNDLGLVTPIHPWDSNERFKLDLKDLVPNNNVNNITVNNIYTLKYSKIENNYVLSIYKDDISVTKNEQTNLYLKIMNQVLLKQIADKKIDLYTSLIIMECLRLVLNETSTKQTYNTIPTNYPLYYANENIKNTCTFSYEDIKLQQSTLQHDVYNTILTRCLFILNHLTLTPLNTKVDHSTNTVCTNSPLYQKLTDENLNILLGSYYNQMKELMQSDNISTTNIDLTVYPFPLDLFTPNLCNYLALLELNDVKLDDWFQKGILNHFNSKLVKRLNLTRIIKTNDISSLTTNAIKDDYSHLGLQSTKLS